MHLEIVAVHGDLAHHCEISVVAGHGRDALEMSLRRPPPLRLARCCFEHRPPAWLLAKQLVTELIRVLADTVRELIHETLDTEAIECVAYGAPVADVDADLVLDVLDREIRGVVRKVVDRLDRERIDDLFHDRWRPTRRNRWRHQLDPECREVPLCIDCSSARVTRGRPILVMCGVVFARPEQLHGFACGLRAFDRGRHEVRLEPAAKASAQKRRMNNDFFSRQT